MVQKALGLTGTGSSVEDAVEEALDRARETIEGITRFDLDCIRGTLDGSRTQYEVQLTVWFTLLERMHG